MAVSGVADAGCNPTGQPAAIAGATLWQTRFNGKLKGEMAPTTPIGTRFTKPVLPSPAELASMVISSPPRVRATAAANRAVSTARAASMRAVEMGLAASAEMLWANSSWWAASESAMRSRMDARSWVGMTPAASVAFAVAMAASRWSVVPTGTVPRTRPL